MDELSPNAGHVPESAEPIMPQFEIELPDQITEEERQKRLEILGIVAERINSPDPLDDHALIDLAHSIAPRLEKDRRNLEERAETDQLTGLPNRAVLDKALPSAEADPNTYVLVFDGDNFGQVNKKASQETGDEAIKLMASKIKEIAESFRCGERVFRRGGDEFVVLTNGKMDEAKTKEMLDYITAWFSKQEFGPVKVSLSGGMGQTFDEADFALRATKIKKKSAIGKVIQFGKDIAPHKPEGRVA